MTSYKILAPSAKMTIFENPPTPEASAGEPPCLSTVAPKERRGSIGSAENRYLQDCLYWGQAMSRCGVLRPEEFNPILDQLAEEHCRPSRKPGTCPKTTGAADAEVVSLAEKLDAKVLRLLRRGCDDVTIFMEMREDIPSFRWLLDTVGADGMDKLCGRFAGIGHYAHILETISIGMRLGALRAHQACGFACAAGESAAFSGANATAVVLAARLIAHLSIRNGRFAWSGYNAGGDPAHCQALVVDVGRDFLITSEGNLYLTGPGRMQFAEFSPTEFAPAAKGGMFGFTIVQDDEAASWRRDRMDQERRKLGRRGRITRDQRER